MTLVEALCKNNKQLADAVNDKIERTKTVRRLIEHRAVPSAPKCMDSTPTCQSLN